MGLIPVMIVDDDYLVIQDLKMLVDWHELGFNVVATASNGKQAWDLYQKIKPKLIITDIIMPVMNGLELVEKIKSLSDDAYIFILTSYDEFEYAKRALKDGVKDYILKNELDEHNLKTKLTEVNRYYFEDKQALWSSSYFELSDYFSKKDKGNIDNPLVEKLKHNKYYFFIISEHISLHHPSIRMSESQESGHQLLKNLKDIYLSELSIPILFNFNHLVIVGVQDKLMTKKHAKIFAKMTGDTLKNHTSKEYVVFFSKEKSKLENFKTTFLAIEQLLSFYAYFSKKTYLQIESLTKQTIITAIRAFDHSLIHEHRQNKDVLFKLFQFHISLLFEYYDFTGLIAFYTDIFAFFENISGLSNIIYPPKKHHSAQDFIDWLESTLDLCLSKDADQITSYSQPVKYAISYMSMHYGDFDITAEIIAEHVGLSAGHLNILFKQDTNQTLNVFLTNLRVEKAIYFFINSNLKIYEISDKVGYRTSQYFSQMIFNKTGKRPIDFRKPSKKE